MSYLRLFLIQAKFDATVQHPRCQMAAGGAAFAAAADVADDKAKPTEKPPNTPTAQAMAVTTMRKATQMHKCTNTETTIGATSQRCDVARRG